MNKLIETEIYSLKIEGKEYYGCKHFHKNDIMNLNFYEKKDGKFIEIIQGKSDVKLGMELIQKIAQNDLTELSKKEIVKFKTFLSQERFSALNDFKIFTNKTSKDILVKCIREISGINYIVLKHKDMPYDELYFARIIDGKVAQVETIPEQYSEVALLDYLPVLIPSSLKKYVKIHDNMFAGLKLEKHGYENLIVISFIKINEDKASCTKGFLMKQLFTGTYIHLPINDYSEEKREIILKEGKNLLNDLVNKLDIEKLA